MITSIEVNDFGIASVWLKEQGIFFFAPTCEVGGYRVVRMTPLIRKLQKRGCIFPDSIHNN